MCILYPIFVGSVYCPKCMYFVGVDSNHTGNCILPVISTNSPYLYRDAILSVDSYISSSITCHFNIQNTSPILTRLKRVMTGTTSNFPVQW